MKKAEITKAILNTLDIMPDNTRIIVATDAEKEIIEEVIQARGGEKAYEIIQTGAGISNALDTLLDLEHDRSVLNFGYAGSNQLSRSGIYTVKEVRHYHPNVDFDREEPTLMLDLAPGIDEAICYTSQDFVNDTLLKEPVLFDMELAIIARLCRGQQVVSIKVVSDNLSLDEYNEAI